MLRVVARYGVTWFEVYCSTTRYVWCKSRSKLFFFFRYDEGGIELCGAVLSRLRLKVCPDMVCSMM